MTGHVWIAEKFDIDTGDRCARQRFGSCTLEAISAPLGFIDNMSGVENEWPVLLKPSSSQFMLYLNEPQLYRHWLCHCIVSPLKVDSAIESIDIHRIRQPNLKFQDDICKPHFHFCVCKICSRTSIWAA
jgi:hypothetical protein